MQDEELVEQEEAPVYLPKWEKGIPYCRQECCQWENGICRILEEEPEKVCLAVIRTMSVRKSCSEEQEKWRHKRLEAWTGFAKASLHAAMMVVAMEEESNEKGKKPDVVRIANEVAKRMLDEWDRARIRIFSK